MHNLLIAIILVFFSYSTFAGNLLYERAAFTTVLKKQEKVQEALATPPENTFKIVKYQTELGDMSAYLS